MKYVIRKKIRNVNEEKQSALSLETGIANLNLLSTIPFPTLHTIIRQTLWVY